MQTGQISVMRKQSAYSQMGGYLIVTDGDGEYWANIVLNSNSLTVTNYHNFSIQPVCVCVYYVQLCSNNKTTIVGSECNFVLFLSFVVIVAAKHFSN